MMWVLHWHESRGALFLQKPTMDKLLVKKRDLKLESFKRGGLETFVVALPPAATLYDTSYL